MRRFLCIFLLAITILFLLAWAGSYFANLRVIRLCDARKGMLVFRGNIYWAAVSDNSRFAPAWSVEWNEATDGDLDWYKRYQYAGFGFRSYAVYDSTIFAIGADPPPKWGFISLPLWSMAVPSALLFWWTWRKAGRGRRGSGFPVEAPSTAPQKVR